MLPAVYGSMHPLPLSFVPLVCGALLLTVHFAFAYATSLWLGTRAPARLLLTGTQPFLVS